MALELELEASKGIDRVADKARQRLEAEAAKAGLTTVTKVLEIYDELHLSALRTREERKRQLYQSLEKHLAPGRRLS